MSMPRTLVVNTKGTDLFDKGKHTNAHVRLERLAKTDPLMIVVTIFDNDEEDPDVAFQGAESFVNDEYGAEEATRYLRTNGIAGVRLEPGRARAGEFRRVRLELLVR